VALLTQVVQVVLDGINNILKMAGENDTVATMIEECDGELLSLCTRVTLTDGKSFASVATCLKEKLNIF